MTKLEGSGLKVSPIYAGKMSVGLRFPEAYWGQVFASKIAHPCGWQVRAGYWQKDSVPPHMGLSIGLLRCHEMVTHQHE